MSPCKILIVEDESLVAMDMTDTLKRLGYEVLPSAMYYEEALVQLDTGKPDLVLLDINLGEGKTGIDLAYVLNTKYQLPFVFVTSHSDRHTVSDAVAAQPSGYLVKPFDADDLFTSIEVAIANFAGRKGLPQAADAGVRVNDSIFIKTDRNFVKVSVEDICYLEAEHNYIFVHSSNGKHIVRSNFKDFMVNLPVEKFVRVHKSFMVRLDKVDGFSYTDISIKGHEIPLSRMYKDDFLARMNRVQ
ncbi:MAG: response regulator [Chitinophagaceae bacterium]|nr:response regulator [Chitinophagaceae bacterium]